MLGLIGENYGYQSQGSIVLFYVITEYISPQIDVILSLMMAELPSAEILCDLTLISNIILSQNSTLKPLFTRSSLPSSSGSQAPP